MTVTFPGSNPKRNAGDGDQRSRDEACADEQHQRQRNLRCDERVAQARGAADCLAASERVHRIAHRRAQRGDDAERKRTGERQQNTKDHDGRVDRDVRHPWHAGWQQAADDRNRPRAEHRTDDAAQQTEDRAFNEQLTYEARPAGTQRGPDRQLSRTARALDEHEAGHVREANGEQHQHRARQNDQCWPDCTHDPIANGRRGQAEGADVGKRAADVGGDCVELGVDAAGRGAGEIRAITVNRCARRLCNSVASSG